MAVFTVAVLTEEMKDCITGQVLQFNFNVVLQMLLNL